MVKMLLCLCCNYLLFDANLLFIGYSYYSATISITGLSCVITPYCFSLITITFLRFKARLIYGFDKSAHISIILDTYKLNIGLFPQLCMLICYYAFVVITYTLMVVYCLRGINIITRQFQVLVYLF